MKAVGVNRVLVVGAFAAALGLCSQSCPAGTLQIVHSIDFPFPEETISDLAWDGESLLFAINWGLGAKIYGLRPGEGSTVRERVPGDPFYYYGLACDGRYLWATGQPAITAPAEKIADFIQKIDANAMPGALTSTYEAPHSPDAGQCGAAWDGAYLWLSDANHGEIMQLDPTDMTVLRSFSSPGPMPLGLTWGRSSLWCVDGADNTVYQLDSSGNLIDTWSVPLTAPFGLAFDGDHLWMTDNDTRKIYQVAIPEPSSFRLLCVMSVTVLCFTWSRVRRATTMTTESVS
jgi:hypothetical protein